jgi:hypothetical protein
MKAIKKACSGTSLYPKSSSVSSKLKAGGKIKKAVNGTTTTKTTISPMEALQKKRDSIYTATRKLEADKAASTAAFLEQQRSLKARFNEAAKNRNAKLPRQKNGGSVKAKDGKWIQKATASIKKRGTAGKCTPITKPGCTGRARTLAKTFKAIAKKNKK